MDGDGNNSVPKNTSNDESEQRSKYPLRGILANKYQPPYSYADFRAFCLTELSHDNVDFYSEACIYRTEALKRFNKLTANGEEQEASSNQGSRYLEFDKLKNGNLQSDYSSQQNLAHQQQTKQLEEGDRQYLTYILQDISRSYIQTGAPKEINLSQVIRSRLIQYIYDGNNLHPDILLPAMNKAFEMMKTESYPRFLRAILSGQYKSKVEDQSALQQTAAPNGFHENVEIVFPNNNNNNATLKEKELNTQKPEVITKTAQMGESAGQEKTSKCCCIIQ